MKSHFYAVALALLSFTLISCQQEDETAPDQPLQVEVTTLAAAAGLDTTTTYSLGTTGARTRFTMVQSYISEIKLVTEGSDTIHLSDDYILHHAQLGASQTYTLSEVPAGHYTHVVFNLGISPAKNTQSGTNPANPNNFPTGHPLNYAVVPPVGAFSMYWSWNSGYLFHRLEGYVDTSATGTGGALTAAGAATSGSSIRPFVAHVGTNGNARVVTQELHFHINPGESRLRISLDVADMFSDVDLKLNRDTHSFGTTVVAPATMTKAQMAAAMAQGAVNGSSVEE